MPGNAVFYEPNGIIVRDGKSAAVYLCFDDLLH
jgi:hypothetical protein